MKQDCSVDFRRRLAAAAYEARQQMEIQLLKRRLVHDNCKISPDRQTKLQLDPSKTLGELKGPMKDDTQEIVSPELCVVERWQCEREVRGNGR